MKIKRILLLVAAAFLIAVSFCACSQKDKGDFSGKRIGVLTGSVFDEVARKYIEDPEISYFNSNADIAIALDKGKIDGYVNDEPVWRLLSGEYPNQICKSKFSQEEYGFIFRKNDEKSAAVCGQISEYIRKIKADGTLKEIDEIWFGSDESKMKVDFSFTGENGTLTMATTTDIGAPFAYMIGGDFAGYDIDVAARFCKEYGYRLEIVNTTFAGMLASVSSGKSDFGGACITINDERKETMLFSESDYIGGSVLVCRDSDTGIETVRERQAKKKSADDGLDEFSGKRIGVLTGTIFDGVAKKNLTDPELHYFNSSADLALALNRGKIDAYITDEPIWRLISSEYTSQICHTVFSREKYAFIFEKDDAESTRLCAEFNEFLKKAKSDGTLREIDSIWFGSDESKKTVDLSALTGENGTLTFAASTDTGEPFAYMNNGSLVGYDIDVAVHFCKEYGYGLELINTHFDAILPAVSSGKCDFAGSCITITEERRESVLFSDADYEGGSVLVCREQSENSITSREQLAGTKTGVLTGSMHGTAAQQYLPYCEIEYNDSTADQAIALESGEISSYVTDEPVARAIIAQYPDQRILETLFDEDYSFVFPAVNKERSLSLCREFNAFLEQSRADGTLQEIDKIWFGSDESKKKVDLSVLTGENGTLNVAVCSTVGAPFCYLSDGQCIGYDIDIAVRFCKARGYGIRMTDYNLGDFFSCVSSGKCDFGCSGITVLEERKENMIFSDPDYSGGCVVVVRDEVPEVDENGFIIRLKDSFNKTFIRENRYLLFLSGLGTTVLIALLSIALGSVLGYAVYLCYYRGGKIFCAATDLIVRITENTPMVMILMILYYIIFSNSDMSGMWVAVIGFTVVFAGAVIDLFKMGVGAVDRGQREAALALGYTENGAFMRMILPQAAYHFLPGYKSAVVRIIKETAIVGYIAVQDLTKVSDIIRSRTYEAFFPLIVSAVIYFSIALLFSFVINHIEIRLDPRSRKPENILKGVNRDD